ncbi:hypothetical protein Tcan_04317, partial [Toxocara canis]
FKALQTIIDCLDDDERLAHILKRIANAHLKWNICKTWYKQCVISHGIAINWTINATKWMRRGRCCMTWSLILSTFIERGPWRNLDHMFGC